MTNKKERPRPELHDLKCEPASFQAMKKGLKRFELRRGDRDFQTGDVLTLREYDDGALRGDWLVVCVSYVIRHGDGPLGEMLAPGHVAMGVGPIPRSHRPRSV